MLVDNIHIRVVGENGTNKIPFFEVEIGGGNGKNDRETKKDHQKKPKEKPEFMHILLFYTLLVLEKSELSTPTIRLLCC